MEKFNNYTVDGMHVKGKQTLGENIADDGGIKVAYDAYKDFEALNQDGDIKLVGLENLTPDQLFFVAWAQMWCQIEVPAVRPIIIDREVHSPSRVRVMGTLSNSDDFARAFTCCQGTPMRSKNKCSVW